MDRRNELLEAYELFLDSLDEEYIVKSLITLLKKHHCTNGCDINDEDCVTSRAIKAIRLYYPKFNPLWIEEIELK